jgi:hypothetical protein
MFGLTVGSKSEDQGSRKRRTLKTSAVYWLLVLASAGTLAGCGNISVTDRTPPNPPQQQRPPVTQEVHDLAVAAVDFDPALNSQPNPAGRPYYMLVAVENKGNRRETSFNVTAQLLTQDRRLVLISAQRTVTMLAPGDITLVRFPVNSPTPRQGTYILNTQVQTTPRETNTTNNVRVLELRVN